MSITQWKRAAGWLAALVMASAPAWAGGQDFLEPAQAFRGSARVVDGKALELQFQIAPDYHLYRERIAVEAQGATLGAVSLPPGRTVYDDNFGKNVEVYAGQVAMPVPVAKADGDFHLRVNYQGCADKGLCYPPQTADVTATVKGGAIVAANWRNDEDGSVAAPVPQAPTTAVPQAQATAAPAQPAPAAAAPAPESETARVQSALRSGNLWTIAGVFLLAGLLLAFTPCVLPMVPILSSIIVGQGTAVSRARGFSLALAYSLGMALVYSAFGVTAGLLGEGLAAALQNPWVLGAFGLLLATLSLSMFGVFELQMPSFIQSRVTETSSRLPGGKFAGVFLMGGMSALIVGPCVAAPLAGALVFISQTRNVVIGGLALFSLAMGMSVPLLLVGLSAGSLLPRTGMWMETVKKVFGVMLLAVALWIVSPVLPGMVLMLVIGAGLLVLAVQLHLFDRLGESATGRHRLAQGVGLVFAVLGTTQVVGALSGGDNPVQPLRHLAGARSAAAGEGPAGVVPTKADFKRIRSLQELEQHLQASNRPVVLDFYADWCVSCKEMEGLTFSDPAVRSRMSNAVLLQADVTANSSEDKALLKKFGLFGPPGVLFFDPQGREREEARVIGFVPAPKFAASLAAVGL